MKMSLLKTIALFFVFSSFLGCEKPESPDIDLPSSIEFGNSVLFLNGENETGFVPSFFIDTINDQFLFHFSKEENSVLNSFGFSLLPVQEGSYILHEERTLHLGAKASFSQLIAEDIAGWEYSLDNPEDRFFEIKTLDFLQERVLIRFRVKFKLDSKNGVSNSTSGLPQNIKLEGVFYENFAKG
ncbi:MAG TPA: hypothetical protein PKA00_14935 [Saprospiraceae bacterium]|nr:hypothetical protein [Saprospiraceae bacterium]HMQ84207.1 hypothetical protein [Saprospiraceae bacterium]